MPGSPLGTEIGSRFDPMLAKIVAHGRDRAEAFERLTLALDETLVLGVVTNLRFLRWLVRQPVVLAGEARTDTLDRIWPPGRLGRPHVDPRRRLGRRRDRAPTRHERRPVGGRLAAERAAQRPARAGGTSRTVAATSPDEPFDSVVVDGVAHVDIGGPERAVPRGRTAGRRSSGPRGGRPVRPRRLGGRRRTDARRRSSRCTSRSARCVAAGDPIVTLEAMKMEHLVAAPIDGTVTDLRVRSAEQVVRGQALATIES